MGKYEKFLRGGMLGSSMAANRSTLSGRISNYSVKLSESFVSLKAQKMITKQLYCVLN
jgi:hypothetical protein